MSRLAILSVLLLLGASAGAEEVASIAPRGADAPDSPASDASAATAVVESLHDALLSCMEQADALGFEGRYDRMYANLGATFDLPFMARASIGANWAELTPDEHRAFTESSRRLSAARYADNFDSFDEQRFVTHSVEPAARGTLLVRTELLQPHDDDVPFDYRLRRVEGRWRIIDILLGARISELVLWRGQYRSVIEDEGFPELLLAMEAKIAELSGD